MILYVFCLSSYEEKKKNNIRTLLYEPLRGSYPLRAVTFSWWGGIVYLNDPDNYAGWSFYTPVRATQARQVEG